MVDLPRNILPPVVIVLAVVFLGLSSKLLPKFSIEERGALLRRYRWAPPVEEKQKPQVSYSE